MIRIVLYSLSIVLLVACSNSPSVTQRPVPTFTANNKPTTSTIQEPDNFMPSVENPYSPKETDNNLRRDTVTLKSKDLLVQGTFPPQYILALKGTLPTPCHELRVAIEEPDADYKINLEVYSVVDPDVVCIQMLAQLDANIGLNGYPVGKYSVWVNDEKVGEIEAPETSLAMKGYELYSWQSEGNWCFSLLLGTNRLKSIDEITQADGRLVGIADLKRALERLPQGEQIFWMNQEISGLSLPPETMVDEIRAYCVQQGLHFEIVTR